MASTLQTPRLTVTATTGISGTVTTGGPVNSISSQISQVANFGPIVGSGSGQVQLVYSAQVLVPSSGSPLLIDLSGSLVDPLGNAVVFAVVTHLFIQSLALNSGELVTVGGGTNPFITNASNTLRDTSAGFGGGIYVFTDPVGVTVTNSTNDILKLAIAAGTNVPVNVTVYGR